MRDMPRIKSDQERGPIGAWMRRERTARDWSQKEMPERLATVGQRVDADYYRQLEAGKKPGPEVMDALQRLFGSEPQPLPEPVGDDMAALIAALREQTDANRQLSEAVRALAVAVGQSQQVTMAAADGMTTAVHVAIQSALDSVLSRLPVLPDTTLAQTPEAARP